MSRFMVQCGNTVFLVVKRLKCTHVNKMLSMLFLDNDLCDSFVLVKVGL